MKKIVMKLEDLGVETFHTCAEERDRDGTVKAYDNTFYWPCQTGTCDSCDLRCVPQPMSKDLNC